MIRGSQKCSPNEATKFIINTFQHSECSFLVKDDLYTHDLSATVNTRTTKEVLYAVCDRQHITFTLMILHLQMVPLRIKEILLQQMQE